MLDSITDLTNELAPEPTDLRLILGHIDVRPDLFLDRQVHRLLEVARPRGVAKDSSLRPYSDVDPKRTL
jgi:hypothetical protein